MIRLARSPQVSNSELNELFFAAWESWEARDFQSVLKRSLGWVCAFDEHRLIGFVNVAGDGGLHAFLLDATVAPDYQRRGIGKQLVQEAVKLAKAAGVQWLHVDFTPQLAPFYRGCGFDPTEAGLMRL